MNLEQRAVYDATIAMVDANVKAKATAPIFLGEDGNQDANPIFLQAPGGTGKTYVFQALIDMLRGCGKIVLAVGSSGLAALRSFCQTAEQSIRSSGCLSMSTARSTVSLKNATMHGLNCCERRR